MEKTKAGDGGLEARPADVQSSDVEGRTNEALDPELSFAAAIHRSFSGPLPPPEVMAAYERVYPGTAERILAMVEKQAAHRQSLESLVVRGDSQRAWWGLWLGWTLATAIVFGGFALIYIGKSLEGLATIGCQAAVVAGVFVYAKRSRRKELEDKRAALASQRQS